MDREDKRERGNNPVGRMNNQPVLKCGVGPEGETQLQMTGDEGSISAGAFRKAQSLHLETQATGWQATPATGQAELLLRNSNVRRLH